MKPLKLFLPLFLALFNIIFSLDLEFFREDLTFEIKDNYFFVDGIYHFRNTGNQDIERVLFFPFPNDSLFWGEIDSIFAVNLNKDSSNTVINIKKRGATFKIEIKPEETSKFRIAYRQKLLGNRAEYILTTTQSWKRPLEQANYTLISPNKLSIDSLSYTPDSFETKRDMIIFFWEKENFMPDRNFIIILSD